MTTYCNYKYVVYYVLMNVYRILLVGRCVITKVDLFPNPDKCSFVFQLSHPRYELKI